MNDLQAAAERLREGGVCFNITTRGQLRLLATGLGVELGEGK